LGQIIVFPKQNISCVTQNQVSQDLHRANDDHSDLQMSFLKAGVHFIAPSVAKAVAPLPDQSAMSNARLASQDSTPQVNVAKNFK
jgi:hypothetical protein